MSKTIEKWKLLYQTQGLVMSELLRSSQDLTKEQVKELLTWAGEEEMYTSDYLSELTLRKPKIYAVDFDGTLFVGAQYPQIGTPNHKLIDYLKERQTEGDKVILWTCRSGQYLKTAVKNANNQGLYFDAINENIQENIDEYGNNCRKVYADYYIDDHSFSPSFAVFLPGKAPEETADEPKTYDELLYDKIQAEYQGFLRKISILPAEIVIRNYAYEKVIKEEIVSCLDVFIFDEEEAKAMYQMDNALDYIYQEWLRNDYSYMDLIKNTIQDSIIKLPK